MPKGLQTLTTEAYAHKHAGDHKQAFEVFQEAFDLGSETCSNAFPSFELAQYYEEGLAVPKDMKRAFQHYLIAAEGKIPDAQAKVADWLTSGEHVTQDLIEAAQWRQREAIQRQKDAQPPLTLAEAIKKVIAEKSF